MGSLNIAPCSCDVGTREMSVTKHSPGLYWTGTWEEKRWRHCRRYPAGKQNPNSLWCNP